MPSTDCPIFIPLKFNIALALMSEESQYSCIIVIIEKTTAAADLLWQWPGFGPRPIDLWWTEWGWTGFPSSTGVFSSQNHSTNALHSCLIRVPSVLRGLVFTLTASLKKTLLCLPVCVSLSLSLFFSLSLCLSLSLTHTHTHIHTLSRHTAWPSCM
jgi:hypothetical protein